VGFISAWLVFLALDLGLFHRKAHVVTFKEALGWTTVWFAVAALFGLGLWYFRGKQEGGGFCDGLFHRGIALDGQCVRHRADFSPISGSKVNISIGCFFGGFLARC